MKIYTLLLLSLLALSCKKSGTTLSTTFPKNYDSLWYHQLPYWKSGIILVDAPRISGNIIDSMQTQLNGDTAIIYYRGEKLYLWVYDPLYTDSAGYFHCMIGTNFYQNTSSYSSATIYVSKYYSYANKAWQDQKMQVIVDDLTHFNGPHEKDYFEE